MPPPQPAPTMGHALSGGIEQKIGPATSAQDHADFSAVRLRQRKSVLKLFYSARFFFDFKQLSGFALMIGRKLLVAGLSDFCSAIFFYPRPDPDLLAKCPQGLILPPASRKVLVRSRPLRPVTKGRPTCPFLDLNLEFLNVLVLSC